MADAETITMRAALTAQALATLGSGEPWDRKVKAYLRCEALYYADRQFGKRAKAGARHEHTKIQLETEYGRSWRNDPEARAKSSAAWEEMSAADDECNREFLDPLWASERELVLTPAPNLAAALFKVALIDLDEVWNDGNLKEDAFALVVDDMARLAEGGE